MVVARAADIGVEDRRGIGGRRVRGLAIELVVEDRAHRAVGQRADLDGARGGGFEAIGAERAHQAHDAEAGAEALFGMRAGAPGSARTAPPWPGRSQRPRWRMRSMVQSA